MASIKLMLAAHSGRKLYPEEHGNMAQCPSLYGQNGLQPLGQIEEFFLNEYCTGTGISFLSIPVYLLSNVFL